MKKKSIWSLVLTILVIASSVSSGGMINLPSIDDVIAHYTKSAGGRELLSKPWGLSLRGILQASNDGEAGPLEMCAYDSKLFMQVNNGALMMGVNDSVFWRHAQGSDILKVPAGAIAETVAIFDPGRVLRWKQRYPQIAVTGTQNIENQEAYVIETKTGDPASERLFIDRKSWLIVREEVIQKHETFTFGDFRAVDGVIIPFTVHQTTARDTYDYRFSEAKHVTTVDESIFQPR